MYELHNGTHLLIDCCEVSREICLNDQQMLETMAAAAAHAGAEVLSQVRYRFGTDSPPGFAAAVILDESHCTAHSYADQGMIAIDIFTCGETDPNDVLQYIRQRIDLGEVSVRSCRRFQEIGASRDEGSLTS